MTKKTDKKRKYGNQPLTRETALQIMKESGIPIAAPDDPIYNRPPSTIFVRKGAGFSIKKAGPDDPIFKLGFVVGGTYPKRTPKKGEKS